MNVVLFCHSLLSDWNHGNAHFLRGVVTDLSTRGHRVTVYEPRDAWSAQRLMAEQGEAALEGALAVYPRVRPLRYTGPFPALGPALEDADLVLVHEWSEPALVEAVGRARREGGRFTLLFHDTHHRMVTAPQEMGRYALTHYDGVLAFGDVIRRLYLERGLARAAWTWHEAADTRVFRPLPEVPVERDLVWVGNWGDEERSGELHTFLLGPAKRLRLEGRVHGVRYPEEARDALRWAGLEYAGWLANYLVPRAFAAALLTVHVPRRPYVQALPGIPTIRPFEALACGIPLVCAPWEDAERLFTPGEDYLVARDGEEMERHLTALLHDEGLRRALAERGRRTVLARHTCAHRVDALLSICRELGVRNLAATHPGQERVLA